MESSTLLGISLTVSVGKGSILQGVILALFSTEVNLVQGKVDSLIANHWQNYRSVLGVGIASRVDGWSWPVRIAGGHNVVVGCEGGLVVKRFDGRC